MEKEQLSPKLKQLRNFLTDENSEEARNYISDLLSGETKRPEDLFVQKFLSVDLWKELGFADNEIKIEYPAGVSGRVEITLHVKGEKIAVECKKPFVVKKNQPFKHMLDGSDIKELENQISRYLLSHSFIIFTNGFHWYFYSRESYRAWLIGKDKKESDVKPYFQHLTSKVLFDENCPDYILNILRRENILETLSGIESESIRHVLTDEFFDDLKSWIIVVDAALRKAPISLKARTTTLINKLIFVRTMEDVGIIQNGFLAGLWDNKRGARNSPVNFIDHIDDELSEIYDTELFTAKYVLDDAGEPILRDGYPEFSSDRKKNFAYSALPESFFSSILRTIEPTNLTDTGMSRVVIDG